MIFKLLLLFAVLNGLRLKLKSTREELTTIVNCMDPTSTIHQINFDKNDENPNIHLTTPEMVLKAGYPIEVHHLVTWDGFRLAIHRVCGPRYTTCSRQKKKRPVLFLHALLTTSSDWIMNTPNKTLVFQLADKGYDIWLLNTRSSTYSSEHLYFNKNDPRYWDWSFHEIGTIDFPMTVDYVIKISGHPQVTVIGHSMGSTESFLGLSILSEYNQKVGLLIGLAPAIYNGKMTGPAKLVAQFCNSPLVHQVSFCNLVLGRGELIPKNLISMMHLLGPILCEPNPSAILICENLLFFIAGINYSQMNIEWLPVVVAHTPSPVSTKTFLHYMQYVRNPRNPDGRFRYFDYDDRKNMIKYGTKFPPEYQLRKITAPIIIYYGEGDTFIVPDDIKRLELELPSLLASIRVNNSCFNHIDHLYARDADELLYKNIMIRIEQSIIPN